MAEKINIVVAGAYGRMGKTIIRLLKENPQFTLAGALERREMLKALRYLPCPVSDNPEDILKGLTNAVIIDFTAPQATLNTARIAAALKQRMVIGTTGLTEEQKEELKKLAQETAILQSANMSIGINVLLRVLPELAKALGKDYDMEIVEIHHKHKKDAPSGTALMLGDCLANARGWNLSDTRCSRRDGIIGERPAEEIGIQALRGGDVVGEHRVYFMGPGEMIEVAHRAESRENFAQGALRAAAWIVNQEPGKLYTLLDALNFSY